MTQEIKDEINNLVNMIVQNIMAKEIILFGSYAYGTPSQDSDIDLCVVTEKQNKRKIDLIKSVRQAIATIASKPVDLLLYYSDEFYERAGVGSTLEAKIKNEGIKIYG